MKKVENEKTLEKYLKACVESKLKGLCLKILSLHITGLPDRLCLIPGGKILFVELKTTGKRPRRIQVYMHNKLRELGFRVEVIDSKEQINIITDEFNRNAV